MVNAREASSSDRPRPSRATDDRGATTTELAVLMPAVIVVIMMIFQVAMFWHAKQAADVAAEEAVEAAQLATATAADGTAGANTILGQAGNLRNATVTVTRLPEMGVEDSTSTSMPLRFDHWPPVMLEHSSRSPGWIWVFSYWPEAMVIVVGLPACTLSMSTLCSGS